MAFFQALKDFVFNLALAMLLVIVNSALVVLAASVVKVRERNILKAFACSIYIGIVLLISAYVKNIAVVAILLAGMLPVMKFIYEEDWREKTLYFFWGFWLILIMAFFSILFGIMLLVS